MRDGVGGHNRAPQAFMAPFKPHLQGVLCNAQINFWASGLKGLIRLQVLVPKGGCIQVPLQANKWYVCMVLTRT
jgi:hypothetical protein